MQILYINEYYRRAVAVISASDAADVHAGFLQRQETTSSLLTRIEGQTVDHHPHSGLISYRIPFSCEGVELTLLDIDTMPHLYDYHEEPINKRG